jgi:glycosyltransferase involved in cell wall biosynthesis
MKVALIAPDWGNSWIPLIKAEVESRGHEFIQNTQCFASSKTDLFIHAWAATQPFPGTRNVMFLRRYEFFESCLQKVVWECVSDLIVVNSWIKAHVDNYFAEHGIQTKTHLIYNAVDTSQWTYKERKGNHRIGMVCHVHPKKNLPLALEVLNHLPEEYELHIAGAIQDPCTYEYLNHMAKLAKRKVYMYGQLPRQQLDIWWEQMGFCLSTSLSEGNPNNVLEAMAKGIKPVVLNWPGAEDQFYESWVGKDAHELAGIIKLGLYDSKLYREHVEEFHPLANIKKAVDIALGSDIAV